MTSDAIEDVRLLAPTSVRTDEVSRARQWKKLANAMTEEISSSRVEHPSHRVRTGASLRDGRAAHRRIYLAGAAAAAVAAAAVAVPLSLGSTVPAATQATKTTGPVMRIASYRLRLPNSYRLTAATTVKCPVPFGFAKPGSSPTQWVAVGAAPTAQSPAYASQMVAAANAEGSCISVVLAPPYTPTTANPDRDAGVLQNTQSVQVGSYQGRVGTWTLTSEPNSSTVGTSQPALFVEIPVSGGKTQDLVVTADNLSESALVSLVAGGLSVGSTTPASPATTTPNSPATTTPASPATTTPASPATTTPASPATTTPNSGDTGTGGNTASTPTSTLSE